MGRAIPDKEIKELGGKPRAAASCRGTTAVGQSLLGIVIRAQIVDPDREFDIWLGGGFVADVHMRYD